MSTPIEVVVKGSEKVIGYACPECHMFCSPSIYACKWEMALEAAHDHATRCCDRRCEDCGEKLEKKSYYTVCNNCRSKRDAAKEAARFEKATKIPEAEYDGWVYDEATEEYYPSVDEYRELVEDSAQTYLWATTANVGFSLDAGAIVESELENSEHHPDAYDDVDDIEGLQTMLDAWCEKQTVTSYEVDYSRAVVLSVEKPDAASTTPSEPT